jgi:hypothetical protein
MTDPKAALDNNNWNFLHDAVSHNDRAFQLAMRQQAASCFQKRLAGIQPKPMFDTLSKNFRLRLGIALQASAAFFQKK